MMSATPHHGCRQLWYMANFIEKSIHALKEKILGMYSTHDMRAQWLSQRLNNIHLPEDMYLIALPTFTSLTAQPIIFCE